MYRMVVVLIAVAAASASGPTEIHVSLTLQELANGNQ
jgi:hypothetical protein